MQQKYTCVQKRFIRVLAEFTCGEGRFRYVKEFLI